MESRQQTEHIPLFYKKSFHFFIAVGICWAASWHVSKPLNVNRCQPINSFTLTGSQNCTQNVLNINVLFFHCCAFSVVLSCIYSRGMWTPLFILILLNPVNTTTYMEAARFWVCINVYVPNWSAFFISITFTENVKFRDDCIDLIHSATFHFDFSGTVRDNCHDAKINSEIRSHYLQILSGLLIFHFILSSLSILHRQQVWFLRHVTWQES